MGRPCQCICCHFCFICVVTLFSEKLFYFDILDIEDGPVFGSHTLDWVCVGPVCGSHTLDCVCWLCVWIPHPGLCVYVGPVFGSHTLDCVCVGTPDIMCCWQSWCPGLFYVTVRFYFIKNFCLYVLLCSVFRLV